MQRGQNKDHLENYYNYNIDSYSYFLRAKEGLDKFDIDHNPQNLYYASLELRLGIECRLYEYLRSSMRQHHIPENKIKEYSASKLLAKLSNIDLNTQNNWKFLFSIEGSKSASLFEYTPVTKELASFHGKLGEMLHFKFFNNNPHWYFKMKLSKKYSEKSLSDYRDFLEIVLKKYEECTRGSLLNPPNFYNAINELNK